MSTPPSIVRWTEHASAKAQVLALPRSDVEDAVLGEHHRRARNPGSGGWIVRAGRLTVVYEHPDQDDWLTARIVTLWRSR